MAEEAFLVFDHPDAIVFDLFKILMLHSVKVAPKSIEELGHPTSEILFREQMAHMMRCYKNTSESQLKVSRLAICVVTNGFVQSETCKSLISQAEKQKTPVVSLIVESIRDLDGLKAGLLRNAIGHFDVFRDRVFERGYDQCMWLGESFQRCVDLISAKLGFQYNNKKRGYASVFHYSYSLMDKESLKRVKAIMKTFNNARNRIKLKGVPQTLCDHVNFLCLSNDQPDKIERIVRKAQELDNGQEIRFNYYEYMLRRGNVDKNVAYCSAIVRIFDRVVHSAKIFENREQVNTIDALDEDDQEYCYVYKHIDEILKNVYKTDDVITDFLKAEMKKNDIQLDLVNEILSFFYTQQDISVYASFCSGHVVLFMLTKDYFSSNKFKKLYEEAKRVKKIIFLVKLEEFEMRIENSYDQLHIYEIHHKRAECMFDECSISKLMSHVAKYCTLPAEEFKYKKFFHLCICSTQCDFARELKVTFEKRNMNIKCNWENEGAILDSIEKARIVLFCLTNEFLKTSSFQKAFDFAEKGKKRMMFVLMEEITEPAERLKVELSSFSAVRVYENGCQLKGDAFFKLCYIVYTMLSSKQNRVSYGNGEVALQAIDSQYEPHRYSLYRNSSPVKLGKQIAKIQFKSVMLNAVTYVKHLDAYWFVTQDAIHSFSSKFKFTSKVSYPRDMTGARFEYLSVLYDEKKCYLYFAIKVNGSVYIEMFDRNMQLQARKNIMELKFAPNFQIHKSRIFASTETKVIVYNYKLDLVQIYFTDVDQLKKRRLIVEPRCGNYVYFFRDYEELVEMFNINGFKLNRNLAINDISFHHFYCDRLIANNLSFEHSYANSSVFVSEIEYNDHDGPIDARLGEYTCKLNTYPPHLLKHAYLLPCGSLACLECIYENYNLFLKEFTCAACGKKHVLNAQLKGSSVIENNLKRISEIQRGTLKACLDKQSTMRYKLECLEKCLQFVEEELEIRIESLKTEFELQLNYQTECIDRFEKRMLDMSLLRKKVNRRQKKKKNVFDKPSFVNLLCNCPYREVDFLMNMHYISDDVSTPNIAGRFRLAYK